MLGSVDFWPIWKPISSEHSRPGKASWEQIFDICISVSILPNTTEYGIV